MSLFRKRKAREESTLASRRWDVPVGPHSVLSVLHFSLSLPLSLSLSSPKVPAHNPARTCKTGAVLLRSLLTGQRARWHPPLHPLWEDCPTGAYRDKGSVVVGEGGVKNAPDPSLGSQALSVAPELRAVIWLQKEFSC